jgi:diguanylate cyclase (GGDEF)-like protein/PAS domain S-box-containing protein
LRRDGNVQMNQREVPTYSGAFAVFGAVLIWFGVVVAAYVTKRSDLGIKLGLAGSFVGVVVAGLLVRQHRIARQSTLALNQANTALELMEGRFGALLRHAADVVLILTPTGTCVYISPSALGFFGIQPEAAIGRPVEVLLGSGAPKVLEQLHSVASLPGLVVATDFQLVQPNGTAKVIEARLSNLVHDLSVGGIVLHLADITDRRKYEHLLEHQAGSDALTGLLNRSRLDEVLKVQWSDHVRRGKTFAVLFGDLDGFKAVNDRFGHEAGDDVLREVSQRLKDAVRGHDIVMRYGGDEFVIVCPNTDAAESEAVARRVQDKICKPILIPNGVAEVGISLGGALGPGPFPDVDSLMRYADESMYRAKGAKTSRSH